MVVDGDILLTQMLLLVFLPVECVKSRSVGVSLSECRSCAGLACALRFAMCVCVLPERCAASGSASEETSRACSALMGIELILAEFIPIYGLFTGCREQGGWNGGCQTLHVSTHSAPTPAGLSQGLHLWCSKG